MYCAKKFQMLVLLLLYCVITVLCANSGVFQISDVPTGNIDISEYFLSSLSYPEQMTFSYLKQIDFCSSQVVDTYKVRSPPGAIIIGGNCSAHHQLLKSQKSGYKYVLFLDKVGERVDGIGVDNVSSTRQLTLFVAIAKYEDWNDKILSFYTSNVPAEISATIKLPSREHFVSVCFDRITTARQLEMFSFITDFAYPCVEVAIARSKSHTLTPFEVTKAVDLAVMLWEQDVADAARLLSRWLTREMLARTRTQVPIHASYYDNRDEYAQLISARISLASFLFALGDWAAARRILSQQIDALCVDSGHDVSGLSDLCENSCVLEFVASFSTLNEGPPLSAHERRAVLNEDWTLPADEGVAKPTHSPDRSHVLSALTVCIDTLRTALERGGDDRHNEWREAVQTNYSRHPAFWVGAGELLYVSQKFGMLNVVKFVNAAMHALVLGKDNAQAPYTPHFGNFLTLLQDTSSCTWREDSAKYNGWCEDGDIFSYSDMPKTAQSFLRKNVKLGRAKSKHAALLHKAALEHMHNDFSSIFTKMGVYWDDFGSFSTSQSFFAARLGIIMCQYVLASTTGPGALALKAAAGDGYGGCDSADVDLQVNAMGCLFSRVMMATPVIFSDSLEFTSFRDAQLLGIHKVHDMLLPFLNRVSWHSEDVARSRLSAAAVADLIDRYTLMREDKKVTSTPASMMLGYQYELQDMGDVAQAPSSPVAPTFMRVLETGNHIEQLCETGCDQPQVFLPAPASRPSVQSGRVRVGFLSRFFFEHSVGRLMHSVITGLDSILFDVKLFCLCCESDSQDSIRSVLMQSPNAEWIDITASEGTSAGRHFNCIHEFFSNPVLIESALEQIGSRTLDILVYPEIGMDYLTMSFAMHRLAPVQAVFWGHPVSQGLASIDYFISSELFDIHNPRCQFPILGTERCPVGFFSSEQVIQMEGMTTFFPRPELRLNYGAVDPYEALTGLIHPFLQKHVYLLPHTSMKYSTAMIRSIATILLKDKAGLVVILYSQNQRLWFEKLRRSVEQEAKRLHCKISASDALYTFPESRVQNDMECLAPSCGMCCDCADVSVIHSLTRRLVLKPKVDRDKFYYLMQYGSVVLDSFPFGMGVTALEAFAVGTPVVTLPSYQSVPPLVLGMLRVMNLDDSIMVSHSLSEYCNNAIAIATEGPQRDELISEISTKSSLLYDDSTVIMEWELLLLNLHRNVNNRIAT